MRVEFGFDDGVLLAMAAYARVDLSGSVLIADEVMRLVYWSNVFGMSRCSLAACG